MIKHIIFDLDGVLVESKDLHFTALNMALSEYGLQEITYKEHISIYDGLPTKEKLRIRKVDLSLCDDINRLKQEHTVSLLEESLEKNEALIDLFSKLKDDGYVLSVASNSIRYTVQLILFKLGIMKYVNTIMSNEDVENGKPHSEMYLRCILNSKVNPKETLILEDSYVGRTGAYNSGAYLCPIKNVSDVNYDFINHYINKYNGNIQKWKGNKMNILIPMAGAGSRFANAGYTFPKPLIEVNGKPMIQVVVENLNIDAQYIYVVQKEHYEKYNLKYVLEMITPNCKIIQIEGITEGAACTTLLAKEFIDNDDELLIANSDQWVAWDSSDFMYTMQSKHVDGGILTFENTHPKWSYVKLNEDGMVSEVREKMVISNHATVGIYYWKRGNDYVKYAEQMIEHDTRVNGEFYVAPVYNEAIGDNKNIKIYDVEKMMGLGTPEDLTVFLNSKCEND